MIKLYYRYDTDNNIEIIKDKCNECFVIECIDYNDYDLKKQEILKDNKIKTLKNKLIELQENKNNSINTLTILYKDKLIEADDISLSRLNIALNVLKASGKQNVKWLTKDKDSIELTLEDIMTILFNAGEKLADIIFTYNQDKKEITEELDILMYGIVHKDDDDDDDDDDKDKDDDDDSDDDDD